NLRFDGWATVWVKARTGHIHVALPDRFNGHFADELKALDVTAKRPCQVYVRVFKYHHGACFHKGEMRTYCGFRRFILQVQKSYDQVFASLTNEGIKLFCWQLR